MCQPTRLQKLDKGHIYECSDSYFYAAYTVQMSADLCGIYEAKSSQRNLFHRQLRLGI